MTIVPHDLEPLHTHTLLRLGGWTVNSQTLGFTRPYLPSLILVARRSSPQVIYESVLPLLSTLLLSGTQYPSSEPLHIKQGATSRAG
jgi:hypothetical protein